MSTLVSVIMSAYNADIYELEVSIQSILDQEYPHIEFIVIDDGNSTHVSSYLAKLANTQKIKLLKNTSNIGLTKSLIKGIDASNGSLIARQDVDDFSYPDRIAKQVRFLNLRDDIILLGTGAHIIIGGIESTNDIEVDTDHEELIQLMFRLNPICHTSVMFRKHHYYQAGGYDPKFITSQDFDLWFRMIAYGNMFKLGDKLVIRNLTANSLSSRLHNGIDQAVNGFLVRWRERSRNTNFYAPLFIVFIFLRSLAIVLLPYNFICYLQKLKNNS